MSAVASTLRGTFVAMITPFTTDDQLDVDGLRQLIEWWIGEGVHGLIPAGSTGEFLELEDGERAQLIELTVEFAAGRVPVVAGASADGTSAAIRFAKQAEAAGADAVMVVAPFYSRPSEDEIVAHYRAIADSISLPVMAYNNPETTGVDMRPPLLARLAEHPRIRYVKESTRDVRRVEEILRLTEGQMSVFAGILALESFLVGATGWVSVPANVVPGRSADLFESAVIDGDVQRGAKINHEIWQLMALEDEIGKYVQIPKAALRMMGRPAGDPRLPRLPLGASEMERLQRICEDLSLIQPRHAR